MSQVIVGGKTRATYKRQRASILCPCGIKHNGYYGETCAVCKVEERAKIAEIEAQFGKEVNDEMPLL